MAVMTTQLSVSAEEQKSRSLTMADDMAVDLDDSRNYEEGALDTESGAFDSSFTNPSQPEDTQSSPSIINRTTNLQAFATNRTEFKTDLLSPGDTPPPPPDRQASASEPLAALSLETVTSQTPLTSHTAVPPIVEAPISDVRKVGEASTLTPVETVQDTEMMDVAHGDVQGNQTTNSKKRPAPEDSSAADIVASPTDMDHDMTGMAESSGKNVRAREDDDNAEGPAAKKTRTDGDDSAASDFKVPDQPSVDNAPAVGRATTNGNAQHPITKSQQKYLMMGLRNLKRIKDASFFIEPVDPVKLNIPTYFDIVKNPMDIRTMENKLKADQYANLEQYLADMDLIVQNAITFNGPNHFVSLAAQNMKKGFEKQLNNLPKADVVQPTAAEKKAKKLTTAASPPAPKATPARRPSRTASGPATSPTATTGITPFALGPNGVPTIRRDSTVVVDGRPKREIHPPPPRDLPYSGAKPRKKKFLSELKFCDEVIKELFKGKYSPFAGAFYEPVDPVALNIPQYHKLIKKPMDLGTVASKLKANQYENATEFESDIRLIFANCYKFNPPKDVVYGWGKQLEEVFNNKWADKKAYLERHAVTSGSRSPASSPEPDEGASEESEADDGEDESVLILQKQIAQMAAEVENLKKKNAAKAKGSKGKAAGAGSGATAGKKGGKRSNTAAAPPPPAKKDKKKPVKAKEPKTPYVTFDQKQEISEKINTLPAAKMNQAFKIIRDNMPNLSNDDDEVELDIDELSEEVLYKLLQFVRKHAPSVPEPFVESPPPKASAAKGGVPKPKKNKPMSKTEQEARIRELTKKLKNYNENPGSVSPEPEAPGDAAESSGDDDDSGSESEEE